MIVAKFGGTSVGDSAAIERAAGIIADRLSRQPLVVVSALGGATNALVAIAEQAASGQLILAIRGVEALRERHLQVAGELLGHDDDAVDVMGELSATFDELAALAEALSVLGHATTRSLDAIAAKGELLSSSLVVAAFRARGIPAELVEPMSVMITGDQFGRAEPLPERIAERAGLVIRPLLAGGRVPVVGGFVGATEHGIITTLGRGGSDYTASLLGAALGAEAIEIWTDVDGMLTADPRVVPDARLIRRIRFDEASELASFGAKVLHPSTIAPAVRVGIPVSILNARRPQGEGTLIAFDAPRRPVTAIAGKEGVTVVKVRSPRMLLAHGFLARIFEIFDRHRTSVDVVATSEISVSLTIDDARHLDSLVVDLSQLGDVSIERNRGIVALVGAGLGADSEAMARALGALNGARVHMLSLSASGINLTMLVDADQVTSAMRQLHSEFFPPGVNPS
ncbi:MAG TPA: lysine-sensitive aspartokinase 3 [Gemmatimonadaceae bacterium]